MKTVTVTERKAPQFMMKSLSKKIAALTEVFHHREESLQKLLELYSKMYDDLTDKKSLKDKALAALEKCAGSDEQMEKLSGLMAEIGFLEE